MSSKVLEIYLLVTFILTGIGRLNAMNFKEATIITNDDRILKVYNLDMGSQDYIYYSLGLSDTINFKRITKNEIFVIKDNNGNKIDLHSSSSGNTEVKSLSRSSHKIRPAVTWTFTGEKYTDNNGTASYEAASLDDPLNRLWFQIRPEGGNRLSVIRAPKKLGSHPSNEYIIPDNVLMDGKNYTVTSIEKEAFYSSMWGNPYKAPIGALSFPETLEEIGDKAFGTSFIGVELIFPNNLKTIGSSAFKNSGARDFKELYLPNSLISIGSNAFLFLGGRKNCSYNGYYQGNLTGLPDFITTGNCTQYGIDEEAVENYERRSGIRKD